MISILAIGDLHSKRSNQDDLAECADKIVDLIASRSPKAIVILGDLANDHEKVYVTALSGAVKFLKLINDAAVAIGAKLYYIVGNHDAENNQIYLEDTHSFNAFKQWPNITIIDKPLRVKSPDGYITMCPYVPAGRFIEALDTIGRDKWMESSVIFCHQEFLGAAMGAITSKVGDKWPADCPQIVSGHIHTYSRLAYNCLYVGAPMYHTFADEGMKSVSILSLENGAMDEERIDLHMPAKLSVHVTVAEALVYKIPLNARIRMYISGTTQEFAKFKKNKVYAELMQLVKIIPEITDSAKIAKNVQRKGYVDILRDDCEKENHRVKEAFVEVTE